MLSPKKKVFFLCGGSDRADIKISTETYEKFRVEILIRNHVSMMTTVTIIVISMITKIKIAIVIIAIIKNSNNNNSNNNNNNNNNNNVCMYVLK